MRIALVNVWPDSNKGACALTWASLDLVSRAFPGASVALVPTAVNPPDPDPFRHTIPRYPNVTILPPLFDGEGKRPAVQLWHLARKLGEIFRFDGERPSANPTLEWIRNSDLVVSVGGVNFQTAEATLRDDPRLVIRVLPLLAAQRIGIPTVLIGAQIGPFGTWFGGWLSKRIAAKAAAVFSRDRTSASELRRSVLLPDSALALTVSQRPGPDFDVPTLALVISSALRASERREEHVALFVHLGKRLVEAGVVRQVVVVLQTDEDLAISRELARGLDLDPKFFIDADLDPEQLSNLYGACRMVISSRLHAVLLSFLAGVPAISLAPEVTFKERAVLEILGLESLWIPSTTTPDRAVEQCLEIAYDDSRHRRAVVSAVAAARAQWDDVPQRLQSIVQEARRVSKRQTHSSPIHNDSVAGLRR